jgi:hypothetical protein
MKFLFDQSADFRLIPHLRQLGHDVHVISRDYPPGLPDEDVLEIARKERRVLIVADRDFGELIFQRGLGRVCKLTMDPRHSSIWLFRKAASELLCKHALAHAGVIFFRLPGAKLQTKIDQLNTVLTEHTDDLKLGEFLVVTPGQIRIAGRPRA